MARIRSLPPHSGQLSHPNIAGIYGIEERDGARYLVLAYTLRDRSRRIVPIRAAPERDIRRGKGLVARRPLAGGRVRGSGMVACDLSNDSLVPIRTPDGEMGSIASAVWLDASRVMIWNGANRQVFVFDVDSGESRWGETIDEDGVALHALIGGDTLSYSYPESDSDLWLVTLQERLSP